MTTALLSKIEKLLAADTPSSAEIAALLSQTAAEITSITQERAKALDPSISATDAELERISKMTLVKNRLAASVSRLQTKLDDATQRERYQNWKERFDVLEVARDKLADELRSIYPHMCHSLVDLLARMKVNDQQINALHADAPSGVSMRLKASELKARALDSFTGAVPSITKDLQLPSWAPDQRLAYPPPRQRDMSMFAPVQAPGDHAMNAAIGLLGSKKTTCAGHE
jgi:hypothetical protein